MTKTYQLPGAFKVFLYIFGVISLPLLGLGILMWLLAAKAQARFTDEAFEYWWLGSYRVPWEGAKVERLNPNSQAVYRLTSAAGKQVLFKPSLFERSDETRAMLEARIDPEAPRG